MDIASPDRPVRRARRILDRIFVRGRAVDFTLATSLAAACAIAVVAAVAGACGGSDDAGTSAADGGGDGGIGPRDGDPSGEAASDGASGEGATPAKPPTFVFAKPATLGGAIAALPGGGWVVFATYVQTTTVAGRSLPAAGRDAALVKLDASGNEVWAVRVSGTDDEWRDSVAVDGAGNIYASGISSSASVDFGNSVSASRLGSTNAQWAFYAKFDGDGKAQWAQGLGAKLGIGSARMAMRGTTIALSGVYSEPDFVYPTSSGFVTAANGGFATYVVSASASDGNVDWIELLTTGGGSNVAVDSTGTVIAAGTFGGATLKNKSGGNVATPVGTTSNGFVLALGAAGAQKWVRVFSSPSVATYAPDVATDGAGHLVATGGILGPTDLGKGTRTPVGKSDPWVAAFDPATGTTTWDKVLAQSLDDEGIVAPAIDGAGNVAVAVVLASDPSPTTIDGIAMPTTKGMYVAKLAVNGNLKWIGARGYSGSSVALGGEIAANAAGQVAMTGSYKGGSVDLGGGPMPDPGAGGYGEFYFALGDPPP